MLDENASATEAENGPLEGSPLTAAAHLNVLWEAGMLGVEHFLRYDGWGRQGQLIANDIDLPARFLSAIVGSSGASEDVTQRVLDFIHSIGVHATLPRSVLGCWGSIQQVHVPSHPRIPFHARLFFISPFFVALIFYFTFVALIRYRNKDALSCPTLKMKFYLNSTTPQRRS